MFSWLLVLTETLVDYPFTNFHTIVTNQDLELVDNMTDWVQDEAVELYLRAHLLLCPAQDMCFGDIFRRNYTFQLSTHSCENCDCDSQCHRRHNCCPWRSYTQEKSASPEIVTFQNHSDAPHGNSKQCFGKLSQLQCIYPQVLDQNITPLNSDNSYFMVAQCCAKVDVNIKRRCESNIGFHDINLFQPVFSLSSNETYKNQDCAVCNGEAISNLQPWTPTLVCSSKDVLFKTSSYDLLYPVMLQKDPLCNVVYVPPEKQKPHRCFQEEMYVASCGANYPLTSFNQIIHEACLSDYINYYFLCRSPFEMILYKNVFCAMCNTVDWQSDLTIECAASVMDRRNLGSVVVFSAVIDFLENQDHQPQKEDRECSSISPYDKELVCYIL